MKNCLNYYILLEQTLIEAELDKLALMLEQILAIKLLDGECRWWDKMVTETVVVGTRRKLE